jgi:DNA-binding NarL/FixJ family response regulator
LDEAAFAAAWAEGRAMPLAQAFTYALEAGTPTTTGAGATPTGAMRRRDRGGSDAEALTPREQEIVTLVIRGYSNRQVAEVLVASPRTVEWHIGKLLARLGLRSRAQLALWAHEHGIVSAE